MADNQAEASKFGLPAGATPALAPGPLVKFSRSDNATVRFQRIENAGRPPPLSLTAAIQRDIATGLIPGQDSDKRLGPFLYGMMS
eukprot:208598-Hanusia_phi.AAC.1